MSKEDFKPGEYYISKPDGWFIEGTECLYTEHVYDDFGMFEGKIKLENTTTKTRWNKYKVGDVIVDREMCCFDEFIKKDE